MPMDANRLRWGILGLGNIATQFAKGLQFVPGSKLAAVASRTRDKAEAFAGQFACQRCYAGYHELAQDPDIDAVYIATPHNLHHENALMCLEAGKAVLCEKPFTVNYRQAQEVASQARARGLFLMEAMWSRFFPLMGYLRQALAEGLIGEVRMLHADFGFRAEIDPQGRLFNPSLAGGALLDVGVYPIALASMLFGSPSEIAGLTHFSQTGVDEQSAMLLRYPGGQLAVLSTSIRVRSPQEADLLGSEGSIRIHAPWWIPRSLTISIPGQPERRVEMPFEGNGYNYEAAEAQSCIRAGLHESPVMPLEESLSIVRTMDALRAQWGLVYPWD